jgi:heme/copper-type cytochrome/quinol oxidase subunit 2
MKIKNLKFSRLVVFVLSGLSIFTLASAAGFLPDSLTKLLGLVGPSGICASDYITSRVQFVLILALGGIVLVAVVYAMIAAFKYVSSQGEAGKMEDAQKSIKAIFIGIAAMIIAIVGIILVFAVFGAKPADPSLYQTCINAPTSAACTSCKTNGYVEGNPCAVCESGIKAFCASPEAGNTSSYASWEQIKGTSYITGKCN